MSYQEGDEIHIDEEDAAGGSKEGVVRWVLLFSLLAAIVLLSIIWMTGAAQSDDSAPREEPRSPGQ